MTERDNEKFCKLFIGRLNFDTTEETLKDHFEQYGEVVKCIIIKNPSTSRSKGFGFITFKDPDSLDQVQKERPHSIDGKEVDTKRSIPRDEAQENKVSVNKIFVGGLDENTSEEEVNETFSSYGNVEKVEMVKDKNTGRPKRFCFVTFDDHDTVDKCVIQKRFQVCGKEVEVEKVKPKNEFGQNDRGGGGNYGGSYGGGNYGGRPRRGDGGHYADSYGGGRPRRGDSGHYADSYGGGNYGGRSSRGYGGTSRSDYDDYTEDSHDAYRNFGSGDRNGTGGGPTRRQSGGYTQRAAGPYSGRYGGSSH